MRFRVPALMLLFTVCSLALPLAAHAEIPFFGPIIDGKILNQTCPLGWGAVISVINNIISLLLTIAILFIAPLMIAYSGFLFVINPVNADGIKEAKKILQNTVVGIVIALAGWMIVSALMAVLYDPRDVGSAWSDIIGSQGINPCIKQRGTMPGEVPPSIEVAPSVPTACAVPNLSPLTDPLALQMEGGATVIWEGTDSRLQSCVNRFTNKVGGVVTSAYRPQEYQTHFWEIRDRWCTQSLRSNSDPSCSSLQSTVSAEVTKHFGSAWSCGAVGATSRHTSGTGVDISGINHSSATVQKAASESCLQWKNYSGDPYHYDLVGGCSC